MSFDEKAKVFVNTFQDFTRDQQNEVLKQILLKCQVCIYRFCKSIPKELASCFVFFCTDLFYSVIY